MQASSVLPLSPNFNFHGFSKEFAEISSEMSEDFGEKLKIGGSERELEEEKEIVGPGAEDLEHKDEFENEDEDEEEEEDEEEFSFVCMNPDGSPISAEDIFQNGEIRPIFPIFDQSLLFADADVDEGDSSKASEASSLRPPLKKLFVEDREPSMSSSSSSSSSSEAGELEGLEPGTYCEWSKKAVEASPELRKKSNSTGFSRFWRFRELVLRSNSDGKDAFVFLNPNSASAKQSMEAIKKMAKAEQNEKPEKERKVTATAAAAAVEGPVKAKAKTKRGETVSSAHERHYVRNRAKKVEDKRRSYLPYRQDLVGFFTNVNGLSRNIHPF